LPLADHSSEFHAQNAANGAKPVERRGETKLQETGGQYGEQNIFSLRRRVEKQCLGTSAVHLARYATL